MHFLCKMCNFFSSSMPKSAIFFIIHCIFFTILWIIATLSIQSDFHVTCDIVFCKNIYIKQVVFWLKSWNVFHHLLSTTFEFNFIFSLVIQINVVFFLLQFFKFSESNQWKYLIFKWLSHKFDCFFFGEGLIWY